MLVMDGGYPGPPPFSDLLRPLLRGTDLNTGLFCPFPPPPPHPFFFCRSHYGLPLSPRMETHWFERTSSLSRVWGFGPPPDGAFEFVFQPRSPSPLTFPPKPSCTFSVAGFCSPPEDVAAVLSDCIPSCAPRFPPPLPPKCLR